MKPGRLLERKLTSLRGKAAYILLLINNLALCDGLEQLTWS